MNEDRRVRYTRTVLQQSLLELLRERPIERITVKEICERADVNRSTFYVHYASPKELLDSIKVQLYDKIKEERVSGRDMRSMIAGICEAFQKHRDLILVICKSGRAVDDLMPIMELCKDDFMQPMADSGVPRDRLDMAYLFLTFGACAVIVSWVLGAFQNSAEEIADEVCRLIDRGLHSYFMEDEHHE